MLQSNFDKTLSISITDAVMLDDYITDTFDGNFLFIITPDADGYVVYTPMLISMNTITIMTVDYSVIVDDNITIEANTSTTFRLSSTGEMTPDSGTIGPPKITYFSSSTSYSIGDKAFFGNWIIQATTAGAASFTWANWEPVIPDSWSWEGVYTSGTTYSAGDLLYSSSGTDSTTLYRILTGFTAAASTPEADANRNLISRQVGTTTVPDVDFATSTLPSTIGVLPAQAAQDAPSLLTNYGWSDLTESSTSTTTTMSVESGNNMTITSDGDSTMTAGGDIEITSGSGQYLYIDGDVVDIVGDASGSTVPTSYVGGIYTTTFSAASVDLVVDSTVTVASLTLPVGKYIVGGNIMSLNVSSANVVGAFVGTTEGYPTRYSATHYGYAGDFGAMVPARLYALTSSTTINLRVRAFRYARSSTSFYGQIVAERFG